MVDEPEPGAAIEVGLKLAVTPVGAPEAESETAELNPPETVVLIVDVPELPCSTEMLPGELDIAKSGVVAAVTVRLTVVVCVFPPPEPVTVME
jgi:hypothetical protein